jgi:hypothetical protein
MVHAQGGDIDQNGPTPAEVRLLLDMAETVKRSEDAALGCIDYRLVRGTAVTLGMQQSELPGLPRVAVDPASNKLNIRRSLREGAFYDTRSKNSQPMSRAAGGAADQGRGATASRPRRASTSWRSASARAGRSTPEPRQSPLRPALRRAGTRAIRFREPASVLSTAAPPGSTSSRPGACSATARRSSRRTSTRTRSKQHRAGVSDKLSGLRCGAASGRVAADEPPRIESAAESARKPLSLLVGCAGIKPASHWLRGEGDDQPAPIDTSESPS